MYHRVYSITPSQQAINGALEIFVEGCRKADVRQQLFGLSVLRSASETQVQTAIPFVQTSQRISPAEIQALLER